MPPLTVDKRQIAKMDVLSRVLVGGQPGVLEEVKPVATIEDEVNSGRHKTTDAQAADVYRALKEAYRLCEAERELLRKITGVNLPEPEPDAKGKWKREEYYTRLIEAIENEKRVRDARNSDRWRWSWFRESTRELELAQNYIGYHRDTRDLIKHPEQNLMQVDASLTYKQLANGHLTEKLGFIERNINSWWSWFSSKKRGQKKLLGILDSKKAEALRTINRNVGPSEMASIIKTLAPPSNQPTTLRLFTQLREASKERTEELMEGTVKSTSDWQKMRSWLRDITPKTLPVWIQADIDKMELAGRVLRVCENIATSQQMSPDLTELTALLHDLGNDELGWPSHMTRMRAKIRMKLKYFNDGDCKDQCRTFVTEIQEANALVLFEDWESRLYRLLNRILSSGVVVTNDSEARVESLGLTDDAKGWLSQFTSDLEKPDNSKVISKRDKQVLLECVKRACYLSPLKRTNIREVCSTLRIEFYKRLNMDVPDCRMQEIRDNYFRGRIGWLTNVTRIAGSAEEISFGMLWNARGKLGYGPERVRENMDAQATDLMPNAARDSFASAIGSAISEVAQFDPREWTALDLKKEDVLCDRKKRYEAWVFELHRGWHAACVEKPNNPGPISFETQQRAALQQLSIMSGPFKERLSEFVAALQSYQNELQRCISNVDENLAVMFKHVKSDPSSLGLHFHPFLKSLIKPGQSQNYQFQVRENVPVEGEKVNCVVFLGDVSNRGQYVARFYHQGKILKVGQRDFSLSGVENLSAVGHNDPSWAALWQSAQKQFLLDTCRNENIELRNSSKQAKNWLAKVQGGRQAAKLAAVLNLSFAACPQGSAVGFERQNIPGPPR